MVPILNHSLFININNNIINVIIEIINEIGLDIVILLCLIVKFFRNMFYYYPVYNIKFLVKG